MIEKHNFKLSFYVLRAHNFSVFHYVWIFELLFQSIIRHIIYLTLPSLNRLIHAVIYTKNNGIIAKLPFSWELLMMLRSSLSHKE